MKNLIVVIILCAVGFFIFKARKSSNDTKTNNKEAPLNTGKESTASQLPQPNCIGVRFDIAKIKSGGYGEECWKVFWRAVDVEIVAGSQLLEGDTNATPDRENVYCLAVKWFTPAGRADEVRKALEKSESYRSVAAQPTFIDASQVNKEPLVDAGRVDQSGSLAGGIYRALPALNTVLEEKSQANNDLSSAHKNIAEPAKNKSEPAPQPAEAFKVYCPKCKGGVKETSGSPVSPLINTYTCTKCSWQKLRCANTSCDSYLEYKAEGPVFRYRCNKCGWSGTSTKRL